MISTQGKKVFQIHLSISIVLILLTLSTLSLFAAFYLGMIAGKSMQRPPEVTFVEEEFPIDNSVSNEDLRFFGLGERKKSQDFLDLEGIKELKNKTEELSKIKDFKQKTPSKIPKKPPPKVVSPEIKESEQKILSETKSILPKVSLSKNINSLSEAEKIYTIQVFASRNHKNAKNLVGKLKKDGFKNAFIFKHSAGSKTLYRVRVGKIGLKDTKILANKLKKLKYIDSVQVSRF